MRHKETKPADLQAICIVSLVCAVLFAGIAVTVLSESVLLPGGDERMRGLPVLLVASLILLMLFCDRLCVVSIRSHEQTVALVAMACAVLLSVCAGVAASCVEPCAQPIAAAVFLSSSCVCLNMSLMTVCIDQPVLNGVISACFAVSLLLLLASTGTLMCSLDVRLLAGLVLAAAICCLQMLPNIVVHVPDRYLVQWRAYMTRRWTVRGGIPEEARVLTQVDIREDMQTFQARYATGFVLCLALLVLPYAALVAFCDFHRMYDAVGFLVLTAALFLFLTLKPRRSGRPFERYCMRLSAVMVMAMACVRAWGFMTTENMRLFGVCAIGLIGVLLVYAIPVQKGGFHSLVLSRAGDALCFLSMMVTPVAAFFAAGALPYIRGL